MKILLIEADCKPTICDNCSRYTGNPPYCGVFNKYLRHRRFELQGHKSEWIVYRCPACIKAGKKAEAPDAE